ncbi:MAG: Release factor glutamine methyltransferase [Marmoricola sp.]|nr:Release factor glutamine methyltransferase [Marmoricola sp.]
MTSNDPAYAATVAALRAAGCVFAEDEAGLVLADGRDLDDLLARRIAGEPLEQVLGWTDFGGLRIIVHPGVFVPRQRTVMLAEQALRFLPPEGVAVDLCCGAGAVAAWLSDRAPNATIYAADIDPVAVRCAHVNLGGCTVLCGDLFAPLPDALRGRVDVIVANTPYVPSDQVAFLPPEAREHEPRHTLDGGPDGLALLRRIAAEAPDWLRRGGHVLNEISASQVPAARDAFGDAGLVPSYRTNEDDGTTVMIGQAPVVRSS